MKKIKKGVFLDKKNKIVYKYINLSFKEPMNILSQEFQNLKEAQNFKTNSNIRFPEPISFNKKEKYFTMKFIGGKNLKDITNPIIYKIFGRELKKIHEEGFTHSHLEIHDVIYKKPYFYLVDLMRVNKNNKLCDYVRILLSLYLYMIKKPYRYYKYKKCLMAFKEGYNLNDKKIEKKYFEEELDLTINLYKKGNFINKSKALIVDKVVRKIALK
ncbi:MAG: hypothetical protein ACOC16_01085 [Nanoarchaeota archaeon]